MTKLAKMPEAMAHVDKTVAVASSASGEASALIAMIERAARDPSVDIAKMERLFEMLERIEGRRAKAAYLAALALMQPALPVVSKTGEIDRKAKDDAGVKQQAKPTKYAKWEDVVEAINPVLTYHGFSLSFRIAQPTSERITVTAVLGHREGHSEETTMSLPIDSTGAKNNVQGWGSSVSYGKRYTAFALLNIVARGEDDDGKVAGNDLITPAQAEELAKLISDTRTDIAAFLQFGGVESLSDIPARQFQAAKARLLARRAQMQRVST